MTGDTGEKLIRMANQIASFFRAYPEAEATAGIAEHIHNFWTPKMRRDFDVAIASNAPGLDPLVQRAMAGASASESPAHKEMAGPEEAGQMASDAG